MIWLPLPDGLRSWLIGIARTNSVACAQHLPFASDKSGHGAVLLAAIQHIPGYHPR